MTPETARAVSQMLDEQYLVHHDDEEDSVSCDSQSNRRTPFVLMVTCERCLDAIEANANETSRLVRERRRQLGNLARPKDWNACPYEAHADDCDCAGRGGDR
jgi:hypothetical protein